MPFCKAYQAKWSTGQPCITDKFLTSCSRIYEGIWDGCGRSMSSICRREHIQHLKPPVLHRENEMAIEVCVCLRPIIGEKFLSFCARNCSTIFWYVPHARDRHRRCIFILSFQNHLSCQILVRCSMICTNRLRFARFAQV